MHTQDARQDLAADDFVPARERNISFLQQQMSAEEAMADNPAGSRWYVGNTNSDGDGDGAGASADDGDEFFNPLFSNPAYRPDDGTEEVVPVILQQEPDNSWYGNPTSPDLFEFPGATSWAALNNDADNGIGNRNADGDGDFDGAGNGQYRQPPAAASSVLLRRGSSTTNKDVVNMGYRNGGSDADGGGIITNAPPPGGNTRAGSTAFDLIQERLEQHAADRRNAKEASLNGARRLHELSTAEVGTLVQNVLQGDLGRESRDLFEQSFVSGKLLASYSVDDLSKIENRNGHKLHLPMARSLKTHFEAFAANGVPPSMLIDGGAVAHGKL